MSQTLPEPTAVEQAHSEKLAALICDEITQHGSISFARYMEMALYQPGLGYYVAGAVKFGQEGDFITAPEISPLFGMCLANQAAELIQEIGSEACLLEVGAGTGILAVSILKRLDELDALPQSYFILELSPDLKQRQKELFEEEIPEVMECIVWLETLADFNMRGMVIANEVLDAMPVTCFESRDDGVFERHVGLDDGRLCWLPIEAGDVLQQHLASLPLENAAFPYRSEINLHIEPWLSTLANVVESGVVLLIDYGYQQQEYYHPERTEGTLLAHYRHLAVEDPFIYPGLMDLTANVDFTAVALAADKSGFNASGFTTQANFLLGAGLDTIFMQLTAEDERKLLEYSQQVKRLTLPSEMGERFKVIGLNRHFEHSLSAFNFNDMSHRL